MSESLSERDFGHYNEALDGFLGWGVGEKMWVVLRTARIGRLRTEDDVYVAGETIGDYIYRCYDEP
jgi:hypothetical protein